MAQSPLKRRLERVQKGIVEKASSMLRKEGRCLVVMTTGTGKTVVGCKIVEKLKAKRVLWLTQTEELIDQSRLDLERFLGCEVGLYRREEREVEHSVVVASLQTIEKDEYRKALPRDWFDLLIVDEAHHAPALSWMKVIDYFRCNRLGLTATPYRHDGKTLDSIFGDSAVNLSYEDAKSLNLIAHELYRLILTNSKIEGVSTRSKDYKPHELDRLVVSQNRNDIIVDSYKKYGRRFMAELGIPFKTLCFCISVSHAVRMRDLFKEHGIKAEILVGKSGQRSAKEVIEHRPQTERERREVYQSFVEGTGPEILCVVNVMNEGKNIPDVGCLLLARPTRSAIIFQQQLGRGCRRIEGKKERYVVLDFVDQINHRFPPITLSKITQRNYEPEQFILDYWKGQDPVVVDDYVNYLSSSYEFNKEPKWTKASIKNAIKAFFKANGRLLRADLSYSKSGLPTPVSIRKYWPSVKQCMFELRIPYNEAPHQWTKERAADAICGFFELNGQKISVVDLGTQNNLPSISIVKKYWGSWTECEKALQLDKWTEPAMLGSIQMFCRLHGRRPSKREFSAHFKLPPGKRVVRTFGSFSKAIQLALKSA